MGQNQGSTPDVAMLKKTSDEDIEVEEADSVRAEIKFFRR